MFVMKLGYVCALLKGLNTLGLELLKGFGLP